MVFPSLTKVTQIGRQVNKLRKWKGGKVSSRAKALVKQWKQLLPEAESEEANTSVESITGAQLTYGAEGLELPDSSASGYHHHSGSRRLDHHSESGGLDHHLRTVGMPVPVVHVESGGDSEASVVEIPQPAGQGHSHSKSRHHKDKGKRKKRKRAECEDGKGEEVFRMFEMSLEPGSGGGCSVSGGGKRRGHSQHRTSARNESDDDVLLVGTTEARKRMRSKSPAVLPVGGVRERSPGLPLAGSQEKNPAVLAPPRDGGTTVGVKLKGMHGCMEAFSD